MEGNKYQGVAFFDKKQKTYTDEKSNCFTDLFYEFTNY
jgi:hypothetical protein